jgi:hypothetical protein
MFGNWKVNLARRLPPHISHSHKVFQARHH